MRKLLALVALGTLVASANASAQQCVDRYQQMLQQFKKNAGECAKNNKLMTGFVEQADLKFYGQGSPDGRTDVPGRIAPGTVELDPNFTRNSAHDFQAVLPPYPDGRWRLAGGRIIFNCTQPLDPNPMPQNEAFLECARVYVCGAAAAQCGLNAARASASSNCNQISQACLAANPVPQGTVTYQATPANPGRPGVGQPTAPPVGLQGQQPTLPTDPRQQAFSNLSPQCQQDFATLLNASQARDSATANAAYSRLRQQCDQAMREIAAASGVALPERALSPRASGAMANAFNRDPNAVTGNIGQPTEGIPQGGGSGVDWPALFDFGIALLGMGAQMAGGWAAMSAASGGGYYGGGRGTDYRSLAPPPVRSTYGQGAPSHVPQRNIPSDITGTK
jgi:hypothetical protein